MPCLPGPPAQGLQRGRRGLQGVGLLYDGQPQQTHREDSIGGLSEARRLVHGGEASNEDRDVRGRFRRLIGPYVAGPVDAGPVDAGPVDAAPVDNGRRRYSIRPTVPRYEERCLLYTSDAADD